MKLLLTGAVIDAQEALRIGLVDEVAPGAELMVRAEALAMEIPHAVDKALALTDDERQAFSPMLAILSSRHETQYSRLFRS